MPDPKPVDIKVFVQPDIKKNYQRLCLEEDIKMSADLRNYIDARLNGTVQAIKPIVDVEPSQSKLVEGTLSSWLGASQRPSNPQIVKAAAKIGVQTEILMQLCDRLFPVKEKCVNGHD